MFTSPTPLIWLICRASLVSTMSLSSVSGISADWARRMRMGLSLGFDLRQLGRLGMSVGSRLATELIAACTSCVAVSMSLSRSNCSVMPVFPSELEDVISVMPGTALSCTSSGVATEEAMVSGLAPGSEALTWRVGNSACGSGATGSRG